MSSFVAAWVGPTILGSTVLASAATGAIIAGGVSTVTSLAQGNDLGDALSAGLKGAAIGGLTGGLTSAASGMLSGAAGAGNTAAGYTLTGDAIADIGTLTDMGYSASAAEALVNTNGVGSFVSGIGTGALADSAATGASLFGMDSKIAGQLIGTGGNLLGGYLNQQAASDAAATQAQAQIRAAQIAADAAKFRPIGVTTGFGSSKFGYDALGNLTSAGYELTPEMKAQQQKLLTASGGMLDQFTGSQAATAPMGQAAQTAMTLGQGYLSTSPQEQAAKYMAEQQALLATGRERDLGGLMSKLQAQGRLGLATGATTGGMTAANPALEAYYNAQRQQDLGLASQATQGGMDYAKFGAGMVGTGGDLLSSMYGTQQKAFAPYSTALGGATTIEGLGQNALTQGMSLGSTTTAANAQSGQLLATGMTNAANTIGQTAQQVGSPWGNLLQGGAGAIQNYMGSSGSSYDPGKFRLVPL